MIVDSSAIEEPRLRGNGNAPNEDILLRREAPEGDWNGSVRFYVDEEAETA